MATMAIIKRAIFFAAFCVIFSVSAMAAVHMPEANFSVKIYDFAELLSADEENRLNALIEDAENASGTDFIVLTVADDLGLGSESYSDNFYDSFCDNSGFDPDKCVILYVNLTECDVHFATYGNAVRMFSSADIDKVLDDVAPLLTQGQFYAACEEFINRALGHMLTADTGIGLGGMALASLLAGLATSLILLMLHSRSLPSAPRISAYFAGNGFTLTNKRDDFLFTKTTKTPIPQQSSSGGGGGGGAHRTPGGRSAGGGGRKF